MHYFSNLIAYYLSLISYFYLKYKQYINNIYFSFLDSRVKRINIRFRFDHTFLMKIFFFTDPERRKIKYIPDGIWPHFVDADYMLPTISSETLPVLRERILLFFYCLVLI